MDINGNESINDILAILRGEFSLLSESDGYIARFNGVRNSVGKWNWASDEMFSAIPFHHEINRFKRGRALNFRNLDEVMQRKAYAFGFNEDRLVLTMHPYEPGAQSGVECMVHSYEDGPSGTELMRYETSIQYPAENFNPKLIAIGSLQWIDAKTQVDVRVGQDGAFSVAAYCYEDGRVAYADRYAQGWNGQTRYDFVYGSDGCLDQILVGGVSWWRASRK
ncbi:hypothetical protein [Ralstonia solanacearum]|uniref:hypothetical protein n=1 Tax=Ralstonia solanacearum TaxID=305 RepID=UPI000F625E99|nr:hypothetical protein [Ralstonia solanacearum]MCG3577424.1 hypothetical protein [Ralstonia solanacearum]MDC6300970.1 hypothetical protein [Ralstonia solanacearum]MDC6315781.1 hypothetical protein [Ralstonia solanacearum]QJC23125.1 hypothetical protein G8D25_02290 [Ralstonia solanacearum]